MIEEEQVQKLELDALLERLKNVRLMKYNWI